MTALPLMESLTRRGVKLSRRKHRLVIDAPKGVLTAEDHAELQVNKPALLEILALVDLPTEPGSSRDEPAKPTKLPPSLPGLAAPRRTPWGTVAYSDPAGPPIDWFGPPPNWQVLATERWGPAVGDPTPGIINDQPDHDWMRATWDAAARAADPETCAERAAIQAEPPAGSIALVRAVVADWPIPWRERWGRRANERAEAGVPHPDDERHAYAEVLAEKEGGAEPPPILVPPAAEPSAPIPWRCTNRSCRDGFRWWLSPQGVVHCLNCVPPAFPESVVAQGDLADAPLCDPKCSRSFSHKYELTHENYQQTIGEKSPARGLHAGPNIRVVRWARPRIDVEVVGSSGMATILSEMGHST